MALPTEPIAREKRLTQFGDDLRKLADYLWQNHADEIDFDKGQEAYEIAIELLTKYKERSKQ